uniref:Secreted protein n=1 Tax=Crocodylus porosus TaxID=8502 RepID=A0A7M4E651_CROPO
MLLNPGLVWAVLCAAESGAGPIPLLLSQSTVTALRDFCCLDGLIKFVLSAPCWLVCCQFAVDSMKKQREGVKISVSSVCMNSTQAVLLPHSTLPQSASQGWGLATLPSLEQ